MTARTLDNASLRRCVLFDRLDDDALARIAGLVKWRTYRRGTDVFRFQDESTDIYLIASGRVRVTVFSYSGKEITYQELGEGDIFGELSAIDQRPRTANVITLESSRIGSLSAGVFKGLLREHPDMAEAVLARLSSMVRLLTERVFEFGALGVRDRVRAEILRLAKRQPTGGDTAVIDPFPTHAEIASRIDTHREAVTREINELARHGLVEQSRRRLLVRELSRLAELLPEDA